MRIIGNCYTNRGEKAATDDLKGINKIDSFSKYIKPTFGAYK
jgi:hypothetical protein